MSSNRRRNKDRRKGGGANVDAVIARNHRSGANDEIVNVPGDWNRRPVSWLLSEKPPLNYQSNIVWIEETSETTFAFSASGAFTELPFGFYLNSVFKANTISSLYDQYCIYSVTQRASLELTGGGTATGGSFGKIYSALDYDSNNSLATANLYTTFATVQVANLGTSESYERYVKPCVSQVTGGSNTTTASGTSVNRSWINTAFVAVPHFGIRWATNGNASGLAGNIRIISTYVIGLRNNF